VHAFWECPVARAVVAALAPSYPAVARHHLWLLRPPSPAAPLAVWATVALAALAAMEYGRAYMWALSLRPAWPAPGPLRAAAVAAISTAAVARLLELLQDAGVVLPRPLPLSPAT
jgi:hypothetical protein